MEKWVFDSAFFGVFGWRENEHGFGPIVFN
jgi:hypothetical protein